MRRRLSLVLAFLVVAVLVLATRLAWVQVIWGPELSAKAEEQRARIYVEPARRGDITDRDGREMSYTMQARSLTVSPDLLRKELREQKDLELRMEVSEGAAAPQDRDAYLDEQVEATLKDMAERIPQMIKDSGASTEDVDSKEIEEKLRADSHYEVLVRNVDPDVAAQIAETFHGVAADHQDIRQYPNGAVGENILGKVSMDGQGQFGFEASGDALLSGINGRMTEDVSTDGQVIPGTLRDQVPAIDGKNVSLTVDVDVQNYLQQKVEQARANSGAKDAEAVVLDAHTGEVVAMANTGTIDPNGDIEKQLERGKDFDNPSISAPYEPGSVAKIITAAGVIEEGLTTPDEVLQVPGAISMSGVTVNDAWAHGTAPYTTTGIFGKSSNVGTLMLAQRLGEEKFAQYLEKFGIGQTTGVELPNESAGLLPSPEQWSGGTFANLPIGQGMSWTTLQMASVYQALANGGERVEPRIIKSVTNPDGTEEELPEPKRTRVVRPETARTVVDMFRAVTQSDPTGVQSGTGPGGAIEGYQTSGKTGTAQQVDPNTGAYSMSDFWITFAGVAPADDPRYVIAVMLDDPDRGVEPGGQGGQSAAPIFRDVASWLLDRDNVPTSAPMEGLLTLQAG
ncbi:MULTISPECIES: penicillin-binding protein 2 [unclassified Corynebacterium]|uniref:peptidoglycan D,D-transpeptidase FtsI family protein n=1 Tax=unclassified Corynebacterium TaxID=2624378 RepID=UPI0029CA0AA1|nr:MULTISPECIES: penicillin-binding protein 2 [unclassified Corynebacterium]WPF67290.1 penicillin-binding protein 2 [Corynebacterium sp. 22KM0430]WPF69779.1 penicillin-binding protein 2 [Corynebacterium sp. 21KM1197]